MADYRIYCVNGRHISAGNFIECESDEAARLHAAALLARCKHSAAEVWDRARFVCRIEGVAQDPETPPAGSCCEVGGSAHDSAEAMASIRRS